MLKQLGTSPLKRPRKSAVKKSFTYREQYGVIVVCDGERQQQRAYRRLSRLGYQCKVVVT